MSDLRKAAEMALEALNYHFDNEDDYLNWRYPLVLEAKQALRQALAMEKFSDVNQEIEEALKPPKREWVGLTDEEIYDYADKFLYQHGSNYGIRSFGKAIEAKLKEKNT
jgi:hypothetical protein